MPNFSSRPRAGLITPPGSGSMHGYRGVYQQQPYGQANRKSMYDNAPYVLPPAPHMYQPPPMHLSSMPPLPPPGLPHPSYGPIAAPILPLANDRNDDIPVHSKPPRLDRQQEQRRNTQPGAKQEKITGGVAQELDYEMDQMTDYVSDMAQSIVMPRTKVSPAFRKFVSGLLSSTRLPSSTILLGLNYLARRMSMLNTPTPRKATDGQVWRMLTIALLLGSKFLDDNTFQNRSWCEVSGIPVAELNTLEKEWLDAIEWNLHVDALTDSDFQSWLVSWASWKEENNKRRSATLERLAPLTPIDTNVPRPQSYRRSFSPASAYPSYGRPLSENSKPNYQSQSRYQSSWSQASASSDLSPPSAPESGPTTPEYMMLHGSGLPPSEWYGYDNFYSARNLQSNQVTYAPQVTPYQTPFSNHYPQTIWGQGHPAGCPCWNCSRSDEPHFMVHNYGQQTVAG